MNPVRGKFPAPLEPEKVASDWRRRGFSCGTFEDPPGRAWRDFTHDCNELITVVEGRLHVEGQGKLQPDPHIPRPIHEGGPEDRYGAVKVRGAFIGVLRRLGSLHGLQSGLQARVRVGCRCGGRQQQHKQEARG